MNVKPILDLIAKCETESSVSKQNAKSSYDVVVRQAFSVYAPRKPITTMTISEVLSWQNEAIKAYKNRFNTDQGYSAVGRYQIIRSTLKGLAEKYWKASDLFDKKTQDMLATELLRRRGLDVWAAGKMSDDKFADAISQEWASLPFNTGYSYYSGDSHGNKSLIPREEVLDVLQKSKISE